MQQPRLWRSVLTGATLLGIPALVNARLTRGMPRLESSLPGDRRYYPWEQGYVFYTETGEGPPVVLVHGVYPGATSYEWRRNVEALAARHRVFALDLLGFGLSDRPRITYDPPLYEALLGDFLQDVVQEPAGVVATALSAAFAIHTAFQRPAAVSRLVLVGPTGLYDWAEPPRLHNFLLHHALRAPVLGLSAYHALTARGALANYLATRLYHDAAVVTPEVLEEHYLAAHQAGASYAAAAFLSGLLAESVETIFAELVPPVLLAWGRHAHMAPVDNAGGFVSLNPACDLEIFEKSGALPHVEEAERFNDVAMRWLARRVEAEAG